MTVYDVLERKKGALDYDKNHFNIIEKYGIHPWQKNLKFLPSWLFSEKDSSMMLHDVLDWKEGFLNYKNIIFYKKRTWYDIWWWSTQQRSLPRLLLWHFNIVKKLALFQKG